MNIHGMPREDTVAITYCFKKMKKAIPILLTPDIVIKDIMPGTLLIIFL